jgi:hypothetical protein
MSMFLLPKTTLKKMEKARKKFFWQGGQLKNKYHFVRWGKFVNPRKKVGWTSRI